MIIRWFLSVILLIFTVSCAHKATTGEHMINGNYQNRPSLAESLFGKSDGSMSEQAVARILNSKVNLPSKVCIGVIKLEQLASYYSNSPLLQNKSFILNEKLAKEFFGKIKSTKRITDVTILPSLMIPSPLTIESLRESAVRLQVDVLLVLRSESLSDYEYMPFWVKDKAKAVSTVEAILLDVRTGVVPFTAVATDSANLRETSEDLSGYALMKRATEEAETKALVQIAADLSQFMGRIP